jgi:catechol 2,3-dioxygenase-like lactoylglutathione lyase family enzyme
MTLPLRFEGFSLRVRDVERSLAFYRDQLGFTVEQRHGRMFALLRLGEGTIGLLRGDLARWPVEAREQFHIELSTDDLDGLYAELQARGVRFSEPPHDASWERAMVARDPDGYHVEFAQGRRGQNRPT